MCSQPPHFDEHTLPPWQEGTNNDATDRGLLFTIPEIDVLADFHGDLTDPKLVLFFGGNYYFATRASGGGVRGRPIRNSRAASSGKRSRPAA